MKLLYLVKSWLREKRSENTHYWMQRNRKIISGKRLSEKYNIPHFDLDDIFWDNSSDRYGVKCLMKRGINCWMISSGKNDWIIEGVFYDWIDGSFRDADVIIL